MKYLEDENMLDVGIDEFILTAHAKISKAPKGKRISQGEIAEAAPLSCEFLSSGMRFRLTAEIACSGDLITVYHTTEADKPKKDDERLARARGFICAYLLGADSAKIKIIYRTPSEDLKADTPEEVSKEQAERFFHRCAEKFAEYARAEIDRVKFRMPSMRQIKFPFRERREAQNEFIKAAYRTIARGGELFAEAPTGTGKTISAIFPAVRAIGDARCEKAFYLTPKTTTANAAKEAIELLTAGGAKIKAIILPSRERACIGGRLCQNEGKKCEAGQNKRLTEAVYSLFDSSDAVITLEKIKSTARDFSVCPHELSLSYAELCDIVICDFNYLFDPRVYIRRFFDRGGEYAFLIDEAHNMPDRAREMYSAEFSEENAEYVNNCGYFSDISDFLSEVNAFRAIFKYTLFPLVKDELRENENGERYGAYHTKSLPFSLYGALSCHEARISQILDNEAHAKDNEANHRRKIIKEYLYALRAFLLACERFDTHYELFIFFENECIRAKIFCLDTAKAISERLACGRASVFFSATLSPIDYYRDALGVDRSASSLSLKSPFTEEQLSVTVMDKVGTRLAERGDTLLAVCRIIAATLSAKRGHYMIFAPSFSYAKLLYDVFSAKYPKIKSILQTADMSRTEKEQFLESLKSTDGSYLAAFSVLGGIFAEGVDLVGERLIGAVIVGIGMPQISYEREAIAAYYDEKLEAGKQHAYIYPGLNRVMQAAGRVIRSENDRGVIVLIDDRFDDPIYRKTAPELWRGMKFLDTAGELREELDKFWEE